MKASAEEAARRPADGPLEGRDSRPAARSGKEERSAGTNSNLEARRRKLLPPPP